tara:strand:- start:408 stop:581 length:174 start_codon:yes stop_codon:yes gene_type:complete
VFNFVTRVAATASSRVHVINSELVPATRGDPVMNGGAKKNDANASSLNMFERRAGTA